MDIAVSVLKVYPIFQFVKNCPKLFIYLGLVIIGASWQQLMRNLDLITGTRMYNQILKLRNERREQKKLIDEKESLKEKVVEKKRKERKKERKKKVVLSSRPKGRNVSSSKPKICLEFKTKKNRNVLSSSSKKKGKKAKIEFKIENNNKVKN